MNFTLRATCIHWSATILANLLSCCSCALHACWCTLSNVAFNSERRFWLISTLEDKTENSDSMWTWAWVKGSICKMQYHLAFSSIDQYKKQKLGEWIWVSCGKVPVLCIGQSLRVYIRQLMKSTSTYACIAEWWWSTRHGSSVTHCTQIYGSRHWQRNCQEM